eukprot:TRINITY_DN8028_c0_g1_i13.p1 TRINITY_DN8028_c0_g1~~TRINITY_DN8028_c0_g1_i13.p1  ORF type:complete len:175 (-),score=29.38 TRINITY_DN8028_c0_g1_i13:44-568(-)
MIIDDYCSDKNVLVHTENIVCFAICISFIIQGVYGVFAANSKKSFDLDKLMGISKYTLTLIQVSTVLLVLIEQQKFLDILYDSELDAGYSFTAYTALTTLPQLSFSAAHFYAMNQCLMYTRSKLLTERVGVAVIYQCYMPGVNSEGLANVLFKSARKYSEEDLGEIEMVDLDKS